MRQVVRYKKTETEKYNINLEIHKDSSRLSVAEFSDNFFSAIRAILEIKRVRCSQCSYYYRVASIISMLALGAGAQQSLEKQIKSMGQISYFLCRKNFNGRVAGSVVRRLILKLLTR
jgi:hypothetical protein